MTEDDEDIDAALSLCRSIATKCVRALRNGELQPDDLERVISHYCSGYDLGAYLQTVRDMIEEEKRKAKRT